MNASAIGQLGRFVGYVARRFPLFYVVGGFTLVVLGLEYAATSLMIPLSAAVAGSTGRVLAMWAAVAGALGLPVATKTWLWLFLVVMIARLLFGYAQSSLTTLLGKQVHRELSARIFFQVVDREPLTAVYTRSIGHYVTLAGDDTHKCGAIISSLLQCVVGASTAGVALLVLSQFSMPIFTAVMAFIAVSTASTLLILRRVLSINRRAAALSRELNTTFIESLNSLRSIRALNAESFASRGYNAQIAAYVSLLFRSEALRTAASTLPAALLLAVAAVMLYPRGGFTLSEAAIFGGTVIVIRVFTALGQVVAAGSQTIGETRAVSDINTLIMTQPPKHRPEQALNPVDSIHSLAVSDVSFDYPPSIPVLRDVSFRFESGKAYAVTGHSGSGKSTLADILLGLIEPNAGALVINDRRATTQDVRTRLMLVEQQPKIFSTTVRENLLFGYSASDEELWAALRMVGLEQHVKQLGRGLDTPLNYLGENLSGGQRQRVGIARALIRRPQALIMDEATSALDVKTATLVVANVRQCMRDGILIFITHDPHLVGKVDAVLHLDPVNSSIVKSATGA
jgi:ATP-binding cassette subfamily B protein